MDEHKKKETTTQSMCMMDNRERGKKKKKKGSLFKRRRTRCWDPRKIAIGRVGALRRVHNNKRGDSKTVEPGLGKLFVLSLHFIRHLIISLNIQQRLSLFLSHKLNPIAYHHIV